jgi:hypothetical protein
VDEECERRKVEEADSGQIQGNARGIGLRREWIGVCT